MGRQEEEQSRHRGYESAEVSYTDRRYGHPAMQLYSDIRTSEIHRIVRGFGSNSKISLLDVGCGTGILLSNFANKMLKMQLNGVDFSQKQLQEAIPRLNKLEISADLINGSAFELPYADDSFDIIVSTRFIHQYADDLKMQILNEIRRCLKPSGLAVVEFYSFVPWLMRYLLGWWRTSATEHFKHCTSQRKLERMIGSRYDTVPLMIPGCTRLSTVMGISGVRYLRGLLKGLGVSFLFDQYLAVFKKV
jgi:ubiquinone/menaquinone biosynthesis C-methylase UbiE